MKKMLAIAVLAVFALGLQANTADNIDNRGYISVNTTAEASIAPDVAEVSIAVITEDNKSMQNATKKNREISDSVITNLKTMINTSNGDYIKTSNFNASPIYTYTKDNKKVLNKYQVSNSVIVHTKSIDKVGAMIDKSLTLGATNVDSLNFSLSNYDSQCEKLIEQASKKATARANAAVRAIPTTLAGIKSMNINCSAGGSIRPQYKVARANLMLAASGADAQVIQEETTTIEQGVIKLNASVSATYFVK